MSAHQVGSQRGWLVVAVGIGAILIAGFLPWLRSGRAWRNSYELVRTADRLGLVGSGAQRVLAISWYLVPLLCGLSLAAMALGRQWLSHLGAAIVMALVVAMIVVTMRRSFSVGTGPKVAAVGALVAFAGSIVVVADRRVGRSGARGAREDSVGTVTRTAPRRRRSAR